MTYAKYDDYMIVEESEAISECNNLLVKGIVAGASSGAVAYAIQNYTGYSNDLETKTIVRIFPDRGERYLDTIYDEKWRNMIGIDYKILRQKSKQTNREAILSCETLLPMAGIWPGSQADSHI